MDHQQTLYIGKTLKRLRNEQKMSQEELAYLSVFSREAISNLEIESSHPILKTIEFIAKALGMRTSDFIRAAEEDCQKPDKTSI